ncbi:OmpA family protein [Candidatus Terasakiella magnetica]|uniref:OmpA family protein n=1 Tax=Candidatus Terasakiella magnetica TaxID=1867952 RepID=A0A1C3RLN8_9PROT|nr:flagellar motor protein MotB [Candidatus Terasakiella magnetica]SCA58187.1 OmpA family protein [Candidatus Terasakiella magnetica]
MAEQEEKKCPPQGSPAWMATFADLMSLLLVLFVLLLTFSEMNVIKYKQMAGAMRNAFGISKEDRLAGVIEVDGQLQRKVARNVSPTDIQIPTVSMDIPDTTDEEEFDIDPQESPEEQASDVENEVAKIIAEEAADQGVDVEREGNEVKIRFPSEIAFGSGSSNIGADFADLLDKLTDVIKKSQGQVQVGGHTDNIPLGGGGQYRSNWDLSAARATSVVHHFLNHSDIAPQKMAVQGFGDSRPLVPNDSPENRSRNRRVEITLVLGEGEQEQVNSVQDQLESVFGPRPDGNPK